MQFSDSLFLIFGRGLKFLLFLHRMNLYGNHPTKITGVSKVFFRVKENQYYWSMQLGMHENVAAVVCFYIGV